MLLLLFAAKKAYEYDKEVSELYTSGLYFDFVSSLVRRLFLLICI